MELSGILFIGGAVVILWLFLWTYQRRRLTAETGTLTEIDGEPETGIFRKHQLDSPHDAVLIASARGQIIHVNKTARAWLSLENVDPDLELFARFANPSDTFLEMFAAPMDASFQLGSRWVDATSYRVPAPDGAQTVVVMREAGKSAPRENDAVGLSSAIMLANDIGETVNASLGLEQVAQTLLTLVRKYVPYDAGELCLWDEQARLLHPRGWIGDVSYVLALAETGGSYAEDEGVSGYIARFHKPVLIRDRADDTAVRPKLESSFRSFAGIPLQLGSRFLGTFELASLTPNRFTQAELSLLQAVAKPMATAIYNAELYAEQARRIEQMASLQQVTLANYQTASDAQTEKAAAAVIRALTERVADLMNSQMAGVLLYDERRDALIAELPFHNLPDAVARFYHVPVAQDSPGRAIWEQEHWYSNDLGDEPHVEAIGMHILSSTAGVSNTLLMPLIVGTRRIGALQVANRHGAGGYSSADVRTMRLLTAQAAIVIEDIRLSRDEQRRDTEMIGLQEIAQAFGALTHEDELIASTSERIARLMNVEMTGILLFNASGTALVVQPPYYGVDEASARSFRIELTPGSPFAEMWATEDYWYTNQVATDKIAISAGFADTIAGFGVQKTLMAAMSAGGRRVGVVQVSNKRSGEDFTERDARLLLIFGAQVAAMLENTRLFRETQRRAEEAELLRAVAEAAGTIMTTEDDMKPVLGLIGKLMKSEAVWLNVLDERTGNLITHPHFVYGRQLNEPLVQNAYAPGFEYSVAISRRPFISNDVLNDKRVLPSYHELSVQMNIHKACMVPLSVGDLALGELGVMEREQDYTAEDVQLLSVVAIQVAGALDRIRLYEASGENLRRRLQELDAIQRVSNELAQTLDLDRLLDMIRNEAVRTTEAEGNTIAMLTASATWLDPTSPQLARRLGERRLGAALCDLERAAVIAGAQAIIIDDYAQSELKPPAQGIRSGLACAFLHEDQVVGVIHLYHSQPHHFDQRAAAFVETMASKASLSYGNNLRYQENRDRSDRLRRRVEQLNQIFELSQMIQSNVDPVTMLEAIAYSIQQSCGYDTVVMTLVDDHGMLRRISQAGMPIDRFEASKQYTMPVDEVKALFKLEEFRISESLLLPYERMSAWLREGIETLSTEFDASRTLHPTGKDDWHDGDMLLVMIPGAGGELLGVISLDRPFDGKRPDRSAIEVLEIFAHQAASTIENTRLYTETARSAEQEARLNEVMEAISGTLEFNEIVESVARGALRLLPFTRMTLAMLNADRSNFDLVYVTVNPDSSLNMRRETVESLAGTALGRTFEDGADYLYYSAPDEKIDYPDLRQWVREGERTSLIVPLITGGLSLGALHFGSDLIEAFGFEQFRALIKRIANLSAVAFVNANLLQEMQDRTQRLALLNNVSMALAQSLDTENILETAVREIALIYGASQARGYIYERGENNVARLVVEYPRGEAPPSAIIPLDARPTFARTQHDVNPILIEDVSALPDDDPLKAELMLRGYQSYGLIPISIGGQANGALELDEPENLRFDPERAELTRTIANQAAIAVLNANLLEQTLVRTRELETLLEAAQATSASLDLQDVFESVARLSVQALSMDSCAVMIYDNVREELIVEHHVNRDGDEMMTPARGTRLDLFRFPSKLRALREGHILSLKRDDPTLDTYEAQEMRDADEAMRILIPLTVSGEAIGLLQLGVETTIGRIFSHREIRMAQALGAQAATSIENARLSTETSAQVEQSMIINEISRAISSTMDIESMIRVIREQIPMITNAKDIYLAIYDAEEGMISFPMAVINGQDVVIPPRRLSNDEVSFVLRFRRPLQLSGENPGADEMRRNLSIVNGEGEIKRYLGVPLLAGDQPLGVLAVRDLDETRPFGLNDQRILQTIGAQLGAAIQNANLFERVRNFAEELNERVQERTFELQQERDRLNSLYQITSELGSSLDIDRVLTRALERVASAIQAESGEVLLIDSDTKRPYTRATLDSGDSDSGARYQAYAKPREGESDGSAASPLLEPDGMKATLTERLATYIMDRSRALETEGTLVIDDLCAVTLPDLEEIGTFAGEWRSALIVRLETNEEVIGAVVLLAKQPGVFGEPQMRLVAAAGNQLAAAISNADLYALIRDQAERMSHLLRAEQEEAEKNTAILEGIADGVILTDAAGKVILFNQAAERILNLPRANVMGESLAHLNSVYGMAQPWVRPLQNYLQQPDRAADDELIIDRIDFGRHVISMRASPVAIADQPLGTVAVIRDITRDVEVDRMKSEFISNVSHELRTPMTSIKGYADLLLMGGGGEVSDAQQRFLQTIKTNADRLAELVNDLLNISRIDSGEQLSLEPVNLRAVIMDALHTISEQPDLLAKKLHVTTQIAPDLPTIQADRLKLDQIMINIIDNAFNYTNPGGSIHVEAALKPDDEEQVLIMVRDTGIGIPDHFKDRVFDRFQRNDEAALVMEVSGTGLGLSIVKDLIEMHEGRVWFDSEVGKGTTFYVTLPVAGPHTVPAFRERTAETEQ
ncbi:GAF domain-containing protein [Anaerolineae bacterium CFX9]|nr:GAF domain-containing protein [Anaerolineae bacterium CFX9]